METLVGIGIFFSIVLLIEGAYFLIRILSNPERKEVRIRLKKISSVPLEDTPSDIERKKVLSDIPWLNRLLLGFRWSHRLNRLVRQADAKHRLGVFVLLSIFLASIGLFAGSRISSDYMVVIPVAVFLGLAPFFYLLMKKKLRMNKFQQQLPDALDLISRALKAGHTFSSGLKMVGDEMSDPIGTEFSITFQEINLGLDFMEALRNLSNRVECPDLKFFVISVVLQRETGGNLVETLENISYLVRERFKLQGRVRALAAQGKLSAAVLVALPFVVSFVLYVINPKYMQVLSTEFAGRIVALIALLLMGMGILVMRKIIDIKV